jgi:hypothetical protein
MNDVQLAEIAALLRAQLTVMRMLLQFIGREAGAPQTLLDEIDAGVQRHVREEIEAALENHLHQGTT